MRKDSLISRKETDVFSPIHFDADIFTGDKALALYKFYTIFFPNIGLSIMNMLMDMEKHSHKVVANIKPEEREGLIKDLEGITVELRYGVKDKGKEIMMLPINISPAEVLKNAILGKKGLQYNTKMQEELNKILMAFIEKEIERRVKVIAEGFLKNMLVKPKIPTMVKELLGLGFINRDGQLTEGTTIMDLVSGKYAKLFEKVIPEELINEAVLIRETIEASYDWKDEDYQALANEALAEKGILEITLGEVLKQKDEQAKVKK